MLQWLSGNWQALLAAAVLCGIVAAVIAVLLRDKKRGKSSCGNNCSHCAMAGKCHPQK